MRSVLYGSALPFPDAASDVVLCQLSPPFFQDPLAALRGMGRVLDSERSRCTEAKTLRLPPPEVFLWQYVYSTPLAGAVSEARDDMRIALEREAVPAWQEFVEDGSLMYRQEILLAEAARGQAIRL